MEDMRPFRARLLETNITMASSEGCQFEDIIRGTLLVGFVSYRIDVRRIWMPQLVVYNGYRGQGIGTDLLNYVIKRGENTGKLFIDTIVHEEAALNWLKQNKFVASHIEKNYFYTRDGIYFRRML
ncbi:MAG: GNAT family N-acetyltransferase [Candidatus Thorarchaeota archaeon]